MEDMEQTLVDVLEQHAVERGSRVAYRFIGTQAEELESITFAELASTAREMAAFWRRHFPAGSRIAISCTPSLAFIKTYVSCLYAGMVAVPTYPPSRPTDWERLDAILEDCDCRAIATDETLISYFLNHFDASAIKVLNISSCREPSTDPLPRPHRDDVAFLQYTSGSTGLPKGVVVSHGNLMANERAIRRGFGHDDKSDLLGWLPMYHDMGLIGVALQPLFLGSTSTMMSPQTFLRSPLIWLRAISRYKAHTSGGPNFAFELCLKAAEKEDISDIDLSSWRVAFNGAEPIDAQTLERFLERFAPCGLRADAIYPCYGLAEATLYVSGHHRGQHFQVLGVKKEALKANRIEPSTDEEGSTRLVGTVNICGHDIKIVDPDTLAVLNDGGVGEVWLRSPSVAQGYWNKPLATAEGFNAFTSCGQGPFLRTGDLGGWCNEHLYITGRLKDMIILNGRNYYATDIERCVQQNDEHLRVGYGAAFSVPEQGRESLVLVHGVKASPSTVAEAADICSRIKKAILADIGVPVFRIVLINSKEFPRTSSGKVRRNACRQMLQDGEFDILYEWSLHDRINAMKSLVAVMPPEPVMTATHRHSAPDHAATKFRFAEIESLLKSWVSEGLDIAAADIPLDATFAEFGIDSVRVIELVVRLEEEYGLKIDAKSVWERPTIGAFADYLLECLSSRQRNARPALAVSE
ncbi:MAG: AMP-binding protein [Moraxellaceae bacterium]|nr:AMP-binding protein [Moraxellaceae bacterium]